MRTEEDEAFDELARKQGMWGGGFQAKRKAAMDKINSDFDEEYIKYRTAFPKEYTAPQPAQEPVAWMSEENNCIFFDADKPNPMDYNFWTPLYTTPPQPVQERNFCGRCGKRTADLTAIHTCTPPQEGT